MNCVLSVLVANKVVISYIYPEEAIELYIHRFTDTFQGHDNI